MFGFTLADFRHIFAATSACSTTERTLFLLISSMAEGWQAKARPSLVNISRAQNGCLSDSIAHSTNEWHTSNISILHPLALDLEQVAVAEEQLPALSAPAQKLSTTFINTSHPILLHVHNAKVHLHQSTLCHQIAVLYFKPTAISMIAQAMCRIWASLPIPYSKTLTTSTFQLRWTTTSANIPRSQTEAEDSS